MKVKNANFKVNDRFPLDQTHTIIVEISLEIKGEINDQGALDIAMPEVAALADQAIGLFRARDGIGVVTLDANSKVEKRAPCGFLPTYIVEINLRIEPYVNKHGFSGFTAGEALFLVDQAIDLFKTREKGGAK